MKGGSGGAGTAGGGARKTAAAPKGSAGAEGKGSRGKGSGKGKEKGRKESPAAREAKRKRIMARSKPLHLSTNMMDPNEFVLSRFIINPWGEQLGESIGVQGKNLIMKKGLKFYSIPIKFIRESGPDLVLTKRVDWAKSLALGERWRKRTLEPPSPKPLFDKSKEIEKGEGPEGGGGEPAGAERHRRTVKVVHKGGEFKAPEPPRKAGPRKKA